MGGKYPISQGFLFMGNNVYWRREVFGVESPVCFQIFSGRAIKVLLPGSEKEEIAFH